MFRVHLDEGSGESLEEGLGRTFALALEAAEAFLSAV